MVNAGQTHSPIWSHHTPVPFSETLSDIAESGDSLVATRDIRLDPQYCCRAVWDTIDAAIMPCPVIKVKVRPRHHR